MRDCTAVITPSVTDMEEILNLPLIPVPVLFGKEAEAYKNHTLHFAMNAGIEVSAGGRLFSCWIGGEDGPEAFLLASYSDDNGETWKDIQLVIDPRSDNIPLSFNVHVAGIWRDPENRMWLFYQQSLGMWDGRGAVFALICEDPDATIPVWNEPVYVCPGAVIKKPIVLSSGEWLLPVSIWERWHITKPLEDCHHELDSIRGANVFASCDRGKTWEYRGGVIFPDSCFNEHSVVELSDGQLMMTVRCNGTIKKTYSADGGRSWSEGEVYFPHVTKYSSMAAVRRLASGKLLLIKHGTSMEEATEGRSHLAAFISADNGQTWRGGLLLDERDDVSYPDICQAEDGTVYVQYDRRRNYYAEILFARFREEDVLAAEYITKGASTKNIIHDLKGVKGSSFELFAGAARSFGGGNGSQSDPYIIATAEELILLAKEVYEGKDFADCHFLQAADINFGGREIFPIGTKSRPFCGCYDGGGHTLCRFKMGCGHATHCGVFGFLRGGTVKDLEVTGAYIRGKSFAGMVVGKAEGSEERPATIEGCTTNKGRVSFYTIGGGICGAAEGFVSIKNCVNNAEIFLPRATNGNDAFAGGILGYVPKDNEGDILIERCVNTGSVTAGYMLKIFANGIFPGNGQARLLDCEDHGNCIINEYITP